MAIHILTEKYYPKSCCGLNLSTKEHSFMFGVVDTDMKNICETCKEKYLSEFRQLKNCANMHSEIIEMIQQGPL